MTNLNELNELTLSIKDWAVARNLIGGSTPQKQMLKLMEEFGELAAGIAKNKPEKIKDSIGDCAVVLVIMAHQLGFEPDFSMMTKKDEVVSYFNSVGVAFARLGIVIDAVIIFGKDKKNLINSHKHACEALLNIASELNVNFVECVDLAYNEIKDRKGRMIDGVFVKEEDLPNA